ncbi:MAG: S-layer homology domain-containing protein [Clostridiales bacterium]|nr:S-layer homology domain-containing protein [Clostridiales bacterium]
MASMAKRGCSLLLALVLALGLVVQTQAASSTPSLSQALTGTAQYVYETVKAPQVGSIGGDWAVLGLARSGYTVPAQYYRDYSAAVEAYVKACNGVLHEKKYTEYSRVILALSSIGKDARDVAGYDLTKALGDYDQTVWQGVNGPIWALLALDCRNYPMPQNPQAKTQATRQMYVDYILSCQLPGGGWNLTKTGTADPDLTAMALQALAKYQDQTNVKQAVSQALTCLSRLQNPDGTFSSEGVANGESCAQVMIALGELGISLEDARFVKNGRTLLDGLLTFYRPGQGFVHAAAGGGANQMACEQALMALAGLQRAQSGQNSLYQMSDARDLTGESQTGQGLPGKHADVQSSPVILPGKTFPDIAGHPNQAAIEALAARGIINGMTDTTFAPDETMTRAQFATIVVRGLGLPEQTTQVFDDVKAGDWFAPYVGSAYAYGIVKGKSATRFDPNGTITRQEAAVMVARAAKLCGLDTELDAAAVRDALAQFTDYVTAGDWARQELAFCYRQGILDDSALTIQPLVPILRCEIAQMLYNLLGSAQLL